MHIYMHACKWAVTYVLNLFDHIRFPIDMDIPPCVVCVSENRITTSHVCLDECLEQVNTKIMYS
jgi:hypothetical protein